MKLINQGIFNNKKWYVVDEISITTYNSAFKTDGEIAIKGNIKMEFYIKDASYVYFTNTNILITKENCSEETIKTIINLGGHNYDKCSNINGTLNTGSGTKNNQ